MLKYCRLLASLLACLVLVILLSVPLVSAQDTEDSRLFLAGFNAYQQQNYAAAITNLNDVLLQHPDTALRDMTLFWLARSHFKGGNKQEAGRFMAQFSREFPENPLKQTVEEDLLALAVSYEKQHPAGTKPAAVATADATRRQAEQERLAKEQQRLADAKAQEERLVREKTEAERVAQEKAASQKLAQEQGARDAADRAEKARLLKAEEQRKQKEQSEQQRLAAVKAEEERVTREKAEAVAAEQVRILQAKAEAERIAKAAAESELLARERAERIAQAKAEAEKRAALKAAEQQAAAQKAAERQASAARTVETGFKPSKKTSQERTALKEKAIAEYKGILERFPNTPAARTAVNRLKALGVAVAQPAPTPVVAKPDQITASAQILTLEVAQYAAFEFNPLVPAPPVEVARPTEFPFEIINRGNGRDSFYLASGFPKEFGVRFAAESNPQQSINQTPPLAPGEQFKGRIILTIPATTIDGLRMIYPVQAASQYMAEATQSREIAVVASAPLLRAVVKADKLQLAPGEKTQYRVTVLNVGSAVARDVTLRINHPPQLEPVAPVAGGLRQEMKAALVLDGLQLKPGESRDLVLPFQVREDALAREELMIRADLINTPLQTRSSFLSNVAHVQPRSDVAIRLAESRIIAIPGQTVLLPAIVVNRGNLREKFSIVAGVPASQKVTVYHDLNRDGSRQANEPEIAVIGPLGPREEAALLFEITTPGSAQDGTEAGITVSVAPEMAQGGKPALASSRMVFSRPVVQMAMKGRDGRLIPGELLTVELSVVNRGSNLAKSVEMATSWPEQMELVATEFATKTSPTGVTWRFAELGAGERRVIKASFRVKPTTAVGTGLQLKSVLNYQDQLGNRY